MLGLLLVSALMQVPAPTQELAPGTRYNPSVPTMEDVVGHDVREEITSPADIVRYFEALARAAPDRTHLVRYAESWEGRPLVALVVGSPERIARLDAIKADLSRLAAVDERSDAEVETLIAELPVVTALMHGVHGNEISSSGAAIAEAYHLLAARDDPVVDLILEESLVLIDPVENPDGRARFVHHTTASRARWPNRAAYSAEHDEPWPGGRVNHYLFDLNRDVFAQSQPETGGKVRLFLEYRPNVVVDLHEMSGNSTYFFPPTAPPANPWYGERQLAQMELFGRANAAVFDRRGFAYFNRDVYDAFYPGYVDMWPMNHGALGMTYEQASARALVLQQDNGDLLTYQDGVLHHFTAAITTAETAARNRDRILRDYVAFRREGVELGRRGPAEYVIHSAHDPAMADRMARMLVRNGIDVRRPSGPVSVEGRELAVRGTYVIPMAQPAHRFVRNLLDARVEMDEDFVRRQIARRAQRKRDEIYDLTAWSQSLLWDVEVLRSAEATGAAGARVTSEAQTEPSAAVLPEAVVGYLVPWGTAGAATAIEALREGLRVHASSREFTLGGRTYGAGTLIVRVAENGPKLRSSLGRIASTHGDEVVPIDDAFVTEGASLGANSVRSLTLPRVLLVYDAPGSAYSVGWSRFVLERRYGQPTVSVRASSLPRAELADFDVIVFPSGDYTGTVDSTLVGELRSWMSDGGTLITMANSTRWAAGAGIVSTEAERRSSAAGDSASASSSDEPIDYLQAIVPAQEPPENVPGAILRVVLDREHWLSAGTDGEIGVLVDGSRVFTPLTLDDGTNVGRYGPLDELVLSGIVWEESRPKLASKAYLMHEPVGSGQVVAFAEDPNYRAYAEASALLFINAVVLGPGR